jgi:hypothetical protein
MEEKPSIERPSLEEALAAWAALLKARGLSTDLVWVFDENLCFERDPDSPGGFRLGFQTVFTPPPPNALQIAYDHFCEFDSRLVFYRIGESGGKSVCLVLCDDWFEKKGQAEGYVRHDNWGLSFRPGGAEKVEEIRNEERWEARTLRDRPLHDLDFCMPLRTVHEILAHGRALSTYERYALRFLHLWRRVFGRPI